MCFPVSLVEAEIRHKTIRLWRGGVGVGEEMMEIEKGKRENQVLFKSVTPAKTDTQRLMDAENW